MSALIDPVGDAKALLERFKGDAVIRKWDNGNKKELLSLVINTARDSGSGFGVHRAFRKMLRQQTVGTTDPQDLIQDTARGELVQLDNIVRKGPRQFFSEAIDAMRLTPAERAELPSICAVLHSGAFSGGVTPSFAREGLIQRWMDNQSSVISTNDIPDDAVPSVTFISTVLNKLNQAGLVTMDHAGGPLDLEGAGIPYREITFYPTIKSDLVALHEKLTYDPQKVAAELERRVRAEAERIANEKAKQEAMKADAARITGKPASLYFTKFLQDGGTALDSAHIGNREVVKLVRFLRDGIADQDAGAVTSVAGMCIFLAGRAKELFDFGDEGIRALENVVSLMDVSLASAQNAMETLFARGIDTPTNVSRVGALIMDISNASLRSSGHIDLTEKRNRQVFERTIEAINIEAKAPFDMDRLLNALGEVEVFDVHREYGVIRTYRYVRITPLGAALGDLMMNATEKALALTDSTQLNKGLGDSPELDLS